MDITLCGSCHGEGYTEEETGNNWSPAWTKTFCRACEGRGCGPIPHDLLDACPACETYIPVRDVVPQGACRFCGVPLALLLPKCFLREHDTFTHTLFHDNGIGAGVSVELGTIRIHGSGTRLIRAEDRKRVIHPGYDGPFSRVVSPLPHHGSFTIELGRLKNVDGEIVESVESKAEVVVTQTLGRR